MEIYSKTDVGFKIFGLSRRDIEAYELHLKESLEGLSFWSDIRDVSLELRVRDCIGGVSEALVGYIFRLRAHGVPAELFFDKKMNAFSMYEGDKGEEEVDMWDMSDWNMRFLKGLVSLRKEILEKGYSGELRKGWDLKLQYDLGQILMTFRQHFHLRQVALISISEMVRGSIQEMIDDEIYNRKSVDEVYRYIDGLNIPLLAQALFLEEDVDGIVADLKGSGLSKGDGGFGLGWDYGNADSLEV